MTQAIYRALIAGLTAVALVGCAQSGNISRDFQNPGYDPQLVQFMAATGQVPVVLVDSPFDDTAVAGQLALPSFYPQAPFVPVSATQRQDAHIVLLFDSHASIDGVKACRDPESGPPGTGGSDMSIQAAFCYGTDEISEAHLQVGRPSGPSDPAFRTAMAQLMSRLMPTISPNAGGCADADC